MQAASCPARQARAHHRHDLRALTYAVLDEANGGIVRNLSREGIGVQAVAALRERQIVRVRFELRYPKLRIEAQGEVVWADPSGQCGIRFLGLSPRMARQINEWIFGNLLESIPLHSGWRTDSIFAAAALSEIDDGLMVSAKPRNVIQLAPQILQVPDSAEEAARTDWEADPLSEPDWLSRPLSGRTLAVLVDGLVITASLLWFSLVFLSVTHELPRWPLSLGAVLGALLFVSAFYWGFFRAFAGATLGARVARLASSDRDKEDEETAAADRFR